MAPALSAVLGAEVAGSGVMVLVNGQLALVGTLTAVSAFLLLSLILIFCVSCQGQKKANGPPGDNENLMNGVSEKETCSQSADSHGTDLMASSSHNGPLTSGTVLTDTMDTSPHLSEEMLSSQSELRSSKCHQDRELPSIPPSNGLDVAAPGGVQPTAGDGTYEVLKESASRDVSVEDSLYETVKELKDLCRPNGTLSPEEAVAPVTQPAALLNGRLTPSPPRPGRAALEMGAEYASVDLNKKSRYSADMEARRSATLVTTPFHIEEPDEEKPPPIPDKVLDENENQQVSNGTAMQNGETHSPVTPVPQPENGVESDNELKSMYSTVMKAVVEEKENDYSSIGEIKVVEADSTSNSLYATVKDLYSTPPTPVQPQEVENVDPGYETIKIPKSGDEGHSPGGQAEPDYESVGELGLNGEMSRL
ncbi:phosphoprotein associated with glycosphingolipid-enriched microdomains 1 [Denticeps clupeoides]|uniref:PHAG1 protein n=1 Tax=Denticeps clupeoides TaxID=299321 RepID=A0AAY4C8X1_9TELE|nr:phosphoprotein associated with glycosphingolipid-enriched microdomains 1 [Denticeps clupeoides]XP_028820445.1 phosphoprotein associated with glycosphingolipid-enriched microdomains 1 [Denticeps clupeoides]